MGGENKVIFPRLPIDFVNSGKPGLKAVLLNR
jgi:hypothetical protein